MWMDFHWETLTWPLFVSQIWKAKRFYKIIIFFLDYPWKALKMLDGCGTLIFKTKWIIKLVLLYVSS